MTQDEIIDMAEQAGIRDSLEYGHMECNIESLEAFAKLVADKRVEGMVVMTPDEFKSVWDKAQAEEREACAKLCDDIDAEYEGEDVLATWCSKAIRARGEQSWK